LDKTGRFFYKTSGHTVGYTDLKTTQKQRGVFSEKQIDETDSFYGIVKNSFTKKMTIKKHTLLFAKQTFRNYNLFSSRKFDR
jgi:hypothetical protein